MEKLVAPQKSKSRASILKAAERLFADQGFRATTLRQISVKSRANGALVSYYFGNKEGLREAVLAKKLESIEKILKPLDATKSVTAKELAKAVSDLFLHVREDEHFHRLALRASLDDGAFKQDISDRLGRPMLERFTSLIQKASGLDTEAAEVRCLVLMGAIHQYANLHCFHRDSVSASLVAYEEYVTDTLVPLLCRA